MPNEQLERSSPGHILAAARENIGVTQREVAEALNLPVPVVEAIETGDKEKLPSHVFVRGYVRAYAKLLDIDPDPLVAALTFENSQDEVEEPEVATGMVGYKMFHLKSEHLKLGVGALAILILVSLLIMVFGGDSDEESDGEVKGAGAQNVSELAASSLAAVTQGGQLVSVGLAVIKIDSEPVPAPDREGAGSTQETIPSESGGLGARAATLQTIAQSAEQASVVGLHRLTQEGEQRLKFEFSEDCWVEIKHRDGHVLYGDLGVAGETLEFIGKGPFRVLLGYAPGAVLKFNYEIVALMPHTRNNVAKLVLGQ